MQTFFENYQPEIEKILGEPVSISGLSGNLRIFQRLNGHRHSIDDTSTAWYALQKSPPVSKVLDLGTGIGSVGLIVLHALGPAAHLTCIEAQDISYKLLCANIKCNQLEARVSHIHGDLRNLQLDEKFPLITGSPPYFPENAGLLPLDSQKAHARFELRGHVGDYASAAKRHLSSDGVFVFCFPTQQKKRCLELVENAGLKICTVRDLVPKPDKPPLFSLYSARLNWHLPLEEEAPFIVADNNGNYTQEMLAMQASRGF